MPLAQIANFDMRILEHVVVSDEDRQETRLRLEIRRRGQERSFEMTAGEFSSNGRLRTAVYGSALPGADLKVGADVLRRAVIALSKPHDPADDDRHGMDGRPLALPRPRRLRRSRRLPRRRPGRATSPRWTWPPATTRSGSACAASPTSSSTRSSGTSRTSCVRLHEPGVMRCAARRRGAGPAPRLRRPEVAAGRSGSSA